MEGTTVERFRDVQPTDFGQQIDRIWSSLEALKDLVVQQVEQEAIPPMTGLAYLSCISAQAFGYQQFHGQPSPTDLISALDTRSALASR